MHFSSRPVRNPPTLDTSPLYLGYPDGSCPCPVLLFPVPCWSNIVLSDASNPRSTRPLYGKPPDSAGYQRSSKLRSQSCSSANHCHVQRASQFELQRSRITQNEHCAPLLPMAWRWKGQMDSPGQAKQIKQHASLVVLQRPSHLGGRPCLPSSMDDCQGRPYSVQWG